MAEDKLYKREKFDLPFFRHVRRADSADRLCTPLTWRAIVAAFGYDALQGMAFAAAVAACSCGLHLVLVCRILGLLKVIAVGDLAGATTSLAYEGRNRGRRMSAASRSAIPAGLEVARGALLLDFGVTVEVDLVVVAGHLVSTCAAEVSATVRVSLLPKCMQDCRS